MPDGRSLCDRRAQQRYPDVSKLSDSEFQELLNEERDAPACGSCLLLAEYIRSDAAVLYQTQNANVYPPKPIDGWRELSDTRWAVKINMAEYLANPELDGQLRYDRITDGIAPHRLQEWIEKETAAADQARNRLIAWREQERAAAPPPADEPGA